MKHSIKTALATAMLIALAMTAPVAAEPPSDTDDMDNTEMYEEEQQEQVVEDAAETVESEPVAASIAEENAPSDEFPDAKAAAENDASAAQTSQPPANRTFKNELKHALLGLLLPAVERRVRKAIDSDDSAPEPESAP